MARQIPIITIGDTPCWHRDRPLGTSADNCALPTPSQNDIDGRTRLSTRGSQLILLSGKNFGSRNGLVLSNGVTTLAELEKISFGPILGTEFNMPLYKGSAQAKDLIPKGKPGCAVHISSFSILCNTRAGILGPHKWIITVKGQSHTTEKITQYSEPIVESSAPSLLNTDGSTKIIVSGMEFGTSDPLTNFEMVFSKGKFRSDCVDTANQIPSGECFVIPANREDETNGKERVSFISPQGWGSNWKLKMKVKNSLTSEEVSTEASSLTFNYGKPEIYSVAVGGFKSIFQLTINGKNFCNRNLTHCGVLKRCNTINQNSTGDVQNATYCKEHLELSFTEADIISWTHSRIVANVPSANGIIYLQQILDQKGGIDQGSLTPTLISELRQYSTNAMTIQANEASDFVVKNGDIVYKEGASSPIATQGGTRATIFVEKLGQKNGISVEVGEYTYTCLETDINEIGGGVWGVSFTIPYGAGPKNNVYVNKNGLRTQNVAYLWYSAPSITSVKMESGDFQGRSLNAGILPTTGGLIVIEGNNFGSAIMNDFSLKMIPLPSPLLPDVITCTSHEHTRLVCPLPPGQGTDYALSLLVGGQSPLSGTFKGIDYALPVVMAVTPENVTTFNPASITIRGRNFGVDQPIVELQGTGQNCTITSYSHTQITCTVPNGQGKLHRVVVGAGGQFSSSTCLAIFNCVPTFSYYPPSVTNFSPKTGRTDGKILAVDGTTLERQIMKIQGTNFGNLENTEFSVIFVAENEIDKRGVAAQFSVPSSDIISRSHTEIQIYQPQGFGADVRVFVRVSGQLSAKSITSFAYEVPTFVKARPRCEMFNALKGITSAAQCYGYNLPGYSRVQDYPKIISIVSDQNDVTAVRIKWVDGTTPFLIEVGDTLRVSGMRYSQGLDTGAIQNFDGNWDVTKIDLNDNSVFYVRSSSKANLVGIPKADTYLGWNHPSGNLRALVSKSYQSANSASFRTLETDGCSTQDVNGIRTSSWESYAMYEARRQGDSTADPIKAAQNVRKCEAVQKILIEGLNLGHGGKNLSTPVVVTIRRKTCDCTADLSGLTAPCQQKDSFLCVPKQSDGKCPASYNDCSILSDNDDTSYSSDSIAQCSAKLLKLYGEVYCKQYTELEIVNHEHDQLVVNSVPGYGRRHQINVHIGLRWAVMSSNVEEKYLRYLPPVVSDFEVHSLGGVQIYRPDGQTKIAILGNNLGFGNQGKINDLIEIRIGTDYDVNGKYCGAGSDSKSENQCMKVCQNHSWHASKSDGSTETKGFPYIDCIIPEDTAGFKNISLRIAGQVDDCSTNQVSFHEEPIRNAKLNILHSSFHILHYLFSFVEYSSFFFSYLTLSLLLR